MVQLLDSAGVEAREVSRRRIDLLWALAVGALALHNAEELLLGLTGWIAEHPWMPGRALHGDQAQFAISLAIVTAAVLAIAVVAVTTRAEWSAGALVGVAWALIINAGSHLLMTTVSWSLMPGTVSGALVLLPLGLLIVRTLQPMRWTTVSVLLAAFAAAMLVFGSLVIAAVLTTVLDAAR